MSAEADAEALPLRKGLLSSVSELLSRARSALLDSGPGPSAAKLQHSALGVVFLLAFTSLGAQVLTLYGSRGLLPISAWAQRLQERGAPFLVAPSLLRWAHSDASLRGAVLLGQASSVLLALGVAPRVCLSLCTVLYLSFAVAGQTFLGFQWDALLVEAGALALFLSRERRSAVAFLLLRFALFKVYFESGIAKAQSSAGDWADGSAMTLYYETAPLPAWPAWYAHHLPAGWHRVESWVVVVLELLAPAGLFGPRRLRYLCAGALALFQLGNLATANYGFFVLLSLALHLSVLDEEDARGLLERLTKRIPAALLAARFSLARFDSPARRRARDVLFLALFAAPYVLLSAFEARASLGPPAQWIDDLAVPRFALRAWRVTNAYHLFATITRERVEPRFEVDAGDGWQTLSLAYEPGPLERPPPFVWPHQPRVDFQLWFYGLNWRGEPPQYAQRLLQRLCEDPEAVQPLFVARLPEHARAVRITFSRYHFTSVEERARSGAWWRAEVLGSTRSWACANNAPQEPL